MRGGGHWMCQTGGEGGMIVCVFRIQLCLGLASLNTALVACSGLALRENSRSSLEACALSGYQLPIWVGCIFPS